MQTEVELTIKGDVTRMRLEPNDRVLVHLDGPTRVGMFESVQRQVKAIFPDHQVVIVANGIRIEVVGTESELP